MAASSTEKRGSEKMPVNAALDVDKQMEFNRKVNDIVKKNKGKKHKTTLVDQHKGCVKLTNIPWGFFEDEMTNYFSQFGVVEAVKLARCPKSGKSLGFAYIKFQEKSVAEVVADTMNNYLMFNKLMKCRLLDRLPKSVFAPKHFASLTLKERIIRRTNSVTPKQENRKFKKFLDSFELKKKQLEKKGITYTLENLDELKSICRGFKKPGKKSKEMAKKENAEEKKKAARLLKNYKRKQRQRKKQAELQKEKLEKMGEGEILNETKIVKTNKKETAQLDSSVDHSETFFQAADGSDDEICFKTPIKLSSRVLDRNSDGAVQRNVADNSPKSKTLTPKSSTKRKALPETKKLSLPEDGNTQNETLKPSSGKKMKISKVELTPKTPRPPSVKKMATQKGDKTPLSVKKTKTPIVGKENKKQNQ